MINHQTTPDKPAVITFSDGETPLFFAWDLWTSAHSATVGVCSNSVSVHTICTARDWSIRRKWAACDCEKLQPQRSTPRFAICSKWMGMGWHHQSMFVSCGLPVLASIGLSKFPMLFLASAWKNRTTYVDYRRFALIYQHLSLIFWWFNVQWQLW